jgi:hypothetical protein
MQKLRSLHLYLGCIFAPLLLFFALSGLWQTFGTESPFLQKLSSIHTGRHWKDGSELTSFPMKVTVIFMTLSFIATTLLGIVMALKFGRSRKAALFCLAAGFLVPAIFVLARLW